MLLLMPRQSMMPMMLMVMLPMTRQRKPLKARTPPTLGYDTPGRRSWRTTNNSTNNNNLCLCLWPSTISIIHHHTTQRRNIDTGHGRCRPGSNRREYQSPGAAAGSRLDGPLVLRLLVFLSAHAVKYRMDARRPSSVPSVVVDLATTSSSSHRRRRPEHHWPVAVVSKWKMMRQRPRRRKRVLLFPSVRPVRPIRTTCPRVLAAKVLRRKRGEEPRREHRPWLEAWASSVRAASHWASHRNWSHAVLSRMSRVDQVDEGIPLGALGLVATE
jgi:hypothetical protein